MSGDRIAEDLARAQALLAVGTAATARDTAREAFEQFLKDAVAAGASLAAVGTAAGLTTTRVRQIVGPVADHRKSTEGGKS